MPRPRSGSLKANHPAGHSLPRLYVVGVLVLLQKPCRAQVLDHRVLALAECLQLLVGLVRRARHPVLGAADRHQLAAL